MTTPLEAVIRERIRAEGPLSLGAYMDLCLAHPEHGYYMTRDPFGCGGDFTTAPEISQLFGEMIGAWLADLWIKAGRPSPFILLECGPGRGTLMADIMRATKGVAGFHEAARVTLMEMSPVLKALQAELLSAYGPFWIDDATQLDSKAPVFLVANEFLDALPVRQFVVKGGVLHERCVSIGGDGAFCYVLSALEKDDVRALGFGDGAPVKDGIYERSPVLNEILKKLFFILKKQSGAALFLDYGYMRMAAGDTLQAVKNHGYAGIFDTPGLCDLTAHVDFENIGRIGREAGLCVHGPVTQGHFLRALGIETRAAMLRKGANKAQAEALSSGLSRLIDTGGMGSMGALFKVIGLTSDPKMMPEGFDENL
ncbi:MAG: SAM-dependent methyltransferase [Micavibrio sp.]